MRILSGIVLPINAPKQDGSDIAFLAGIISLAILIVALVLIAIQSIKKN